MIVFRNELNFTGRTHILHGGTLRQPEDLHPDLSQNSKSCRMRIQQGPQLLSLMLLRWYGVPLKSDVVSEFPTDRLAVEDRRKDVQRRYDAC